MSTQFDFKKEWEKTKKQLLDFSKEATKMAKKGEEELVKFSHKSMVHIDATAANLKKEKLYYQIGKKYIESLNSGKEASALATLVEEYHETVKEEQDLQKRIKAQAKAEAKKAPAKKAKKKGGSTASKTTAQKTAKKAAKNTKKAAKKKSSGS